MATPKKKVIKKRIERCIPIDRYEMGIDLEEFILMIDKECAHLDVEESEIMGEHFVGTASKTRVLVRCSYDEGSYMRNDGIEMVVYKDIKTYRMETQKEAERREARARKAKETAEKNRRKAEERELKVLARLKEKYG